MKHLIGLVLGTEDDWPTAFEALAARVGTFEWRGELYRFTSGGRIVAARLGTTADEPEAVVAEKFN